MAAVVPDVHLEEFAEQPQSQSMLLGRTRVGPGLKCKDGSILTPSKEEFDGPGVIQPPTPGKPQELCSPSDCTFSPMKWGFTPIQTPSPSARFASYEHHCLITPGARAAAALRSQSLLEGWMMARGVPAGGAQDEAGAPAAYLEQHSSQALIGFDQPSIADHDEEESDSDESDVPVQQAVATSDRDIPARPAGVHHPSVGSANHAMGTCKRCCFFPRGRCQNGYNCEFCHYEHEKRKRKNKTRGLIQKLSFRPLPPLTMAPPGAHSTQAFAAPALWSAMHQQPQQVTLMDLGLQRMVCPPAPATQYAPPNFQAPPQVQLQPLQQPCAYAGFQGGATFMQDPAQSYVMGTASSFYAMAPQYPQPTFQYPQQPGAGAYQMAVASMHPQVAAGYAQPPPPPMQPPSFCGPLGF